MNKQDIHLIEITSKQQFYQIINQNSNQEFELSNHVLIKYSYKPRLANKIQIYCLTRPILWKSKYIKTIILLNIYNHHEYMIESLQKFLVNPKNIEQLTLVNDTKSLNKLLSKLTF